MRTADITFANLLIDEYTSRESARGVSFDPYDLDDPITPPPAPPTETLDTFRARFELTFPKLPEPDAILSLHPIVHKLIAYDRQVIAEQKRGGWNRPTYQDDKGKMSLEWLNLLLHHFSLLGFPVHLRGRKYVRFEVTILGSRREFVFFINETNSYVTRYKPKPQSQTRTYCFRWQEDSDRYRRRKNYYEYSTPSADCIKEIVMDVVMARENEYRDRVVSEYEENVALRERLIEKRNEQRELLGRRRRCRSNQLSNTRQHLLLSAITGMNDADRIRELIAIVERKSQTSKRPIKHLNRWVRWATHHANVLDLRHMSIRGLDAWIGKFKLKH